VSIGGYKDSKAGGKVIFVSADHASFTENAGWRRLHGPTGEMQQGAHGHSEVAPGFDAGMHTHTNDVWIAGCEGAYLYKTKRRKRVGQGFLKVPET